MTVLILVLGPAPYGVTPVSWDPLSASVGVVQPSADGLKGDVTVSVVAFAPGGAMCLRSTGVSRGVYNIYIIYPKSRI